MRAVGREHAASYRVGGGAKEECMDKICSGGTCLGYFSKVMVNAFITNYKTISFFHIFSDVAIGSQNSPLLN